MQQGESQVAVFLCGCTNHVAGKVKLDELVTHFASRPDVAFVATHELLCAPAGRELVAERVKESGAERIVVAACSPKDHEDTFMQVLEEVGINRYLMQMANIREHCSWITQDAMAATRKARALIEAALARVKRHDPIERREMECNTDVLVVGGGIAGIEAALQVANAGRRVTLIETAMSLGGQVPELEEVAPNRECAPCLIAPHLSDVESHPNVTRLTGTEVDRVVGYFGNFTVRATSRPRWVDPELCFGCDECMQVCPAELDDPYQRGLGKRKAIDIPFPGSVPNCAEIDPDACLRFNGSQPCCDACALACPMGAVAFEQEAQQHELAAGAIVVATGASIYDPTPLQELGYRALPDVYTAAEVERLVSSNGPTGGKLLKRDGTQPQRIAILHCVGRSRLGYCSGICCQTGVKLAILARHQLASEVVVLHTDLVLPGHQAEALRRQAQSARFVRVIDAAATRVEAHGERMRIRYMTNLERDASIDVDLVVLVTGLLPSAGTKRIARQIGLETDASGFIAADHSLLRPARASLRGVYVAGCAGGPQGIGASIAQAEAATGSLLSELRPGELLRTSDRIAELAAELCSGCKFCVAACPYSATFVDTTGEVVLNPVLCQGCGTCVAACPSGAARARHFRDDQLVAELSEVLRD